MYTTEYQFNGTWYVNGGESFWVVSSNGVVLLQFDINTLDIKKTVVNSKIDPTTPHGFLPWE
jgi:hypothetical protein